LLEYICIIEWMGLVGPEYYCSCNIQAVHITRQGYYQAQHTVYIRKHAAKKTPAITFTWRTHAKIFIIFTLNFLGKGGIHMWDGTNWIQFRGNRVIKRKKPTCMCTTLWMVIRSSIGTIKNRKWCLGYYWAINAIHSNPSPPTSSYSLLVLLSV